MHLPLTAKGIECGVLQLHCQEPHPRAIFIKLNFAFLTDFSLAGTVSLALPNPKPIYPSELPTTA